MAFFRRFAAGLVTGAMLLTTAGAAVSATVVKNTEIKAETTDKGLYKVTFSDSSKLQNGNQYVLLVASFDKASTASGTVNVTIDESTLTFIDQAEAKSGAVSFDVRPKSYPNSLVLLGGDFNGATSPIVIGYIDSTGTPLTGVKITAADSSGKTVDLSNIVFTITDSSGNSVTLDVAADGTVSGTVPEGTGLTITLTRDGYVPMTLTNYSAGKSIDNQLKRFDKCAGDIAGNDNEITLRDIRAVIAELNKSGTDADLNKDGSVTLQDIRIVISNLGADVSNRTVRLP